jgi:hypothetical protein
MKMETKKTNVVAIRENAVAMPLVEMQTIAAAFAKSGLFGAKTPDQALALMLVAQAEGLHPATAARDYDIIQGRPAKKSEAMQRDFLRTGGAIEWHDLSDTIADATFSHPQGGKVRIVWDMNRAVKAGLGVKDMWKKYPRQMLRSRVVSEGVRTVCPMATSGVYSPEEVIDMPPMRDVTPPVERPTPPTRKQFVEVKTEAEPADAGQPDLDGEYRQIVNDRMPDTPEERGDEPEAQARTSAEWSDWATTAAAKVKKIKDPAELQNWLEATELERAQLKDALPSWHGRLLERIVERERELG